MTSSQLGPAAAVFILAYTVGGGVPTPATTDQGALGEQVYEDNCALCHETDGAGIEELVPPLTGNPRVEDVAYLERITREGLSGPIEVNGLAYDEEMPPSDLTDAEVEAVVAYVLSAFVSPSTAAPTPATAPQPIPAGTAATGADLYLGRRRLQNGGPACGACHTAGSHDNLGGGSLGPDLTDLYTRFGGEQKAVTALRNAPSPVMRPLYDGKPLTDEETGHLLAFFAQTVEQQPPERFDRLFAVGLAGALLLFAVMLLAPSRSRESYVRKLRGRR